MPTPAAAELCRVRLPFGELVPDPREAWSRLVRIVLLKLPFMVRGTPEVVEGELPFRIDAEASPASVVVAGPRVVTETGLGERRRFDGLYHLPGGMRRYRDTLDELLRAFEAEPRGLRGFMELLLLRYGITGESMAKAYLRVLQSTGFVQQIGDIYSLSESGVTYLQHPSSEAVFAALHFGFTGVLATLLLIREAGVLDSAAGDRLREILGVDWQTRTQIHVRRNWLLSLGLTERNLRGDSITEAGRRVLEAYPEELAVLLPVVQEALTNETGAVAGAEHLAVHIGEERRATRRPSDAREELITATELDLRPSLVRPFLNGYSPPGRVIEQCCAALSAGKHLLLVGPPGTGKTELAQILANVARSETYCSGLLTATASADWTTFDTIGGYALQKGGELEFRPGLFLRALETDRWLLVDELNRADVDRAFGELMTVLAGKGAEAPYKTESGAPVTIGSDEGSTFRVFEAFRVIATMNTWDKTSLFRLSTALQRRFATVHVGLPSPSEYAQLLRGRAEKKYPVLDAHFVALLVSLFSPAGILQWRPIGPAVPLDILAYLARRDPVSEGLPEALALYLLPQLEGLPLVSAKKLREHLEGRLVGVAEPSALTELWERFRELFPTLGES